MSVSQQILDRSLEQLLQRACAIPEVEREFSSSIATFFSRAEPDSNALDELAARRHSEWFLLERFCEHLQAVPVEWMLEDLSSAAHDLQDAMESLLSSQCGVFEVTGVQTGLGVWLRDLASQGQYPLDEAEGSHALEAGDLLIGRIFPVGDQLYRISHAAGFFRNPELLSALSVDLERARANHRGVLRLKQSELESMFFTPSAQVAASREVRVEGARVALGQCDVPVGMIDEILEELCTTPYDAARLVPGAGDLLGSILDRLAFDTTTDIERARQVILALWPALAPEISVNSDGGATSVQPRPQTLDPQAAIESFDRGRAEGRDLESLFTQLEEDLGLGPSGDEPDNEIAPDFPGVVAAMVEEFLWETRREHGSELARRYECLSSFASYGEPLGVFENLSERDLLLYLAVWLPEQRLAQTREQVLDLLEALKAFCAWAEEQHEVPLASALAKTYDGLRENLPRVVAANQALGDPSVEDNGVSHMLEVLGSDLRRARDAAGVEHELNLDETLAGYIQAGDRLRARASDDGCWTVLCCYPPESGRLALDV